MNLTLPIVLRIVAALIAIVATAGFVVADSNVIPGLVVATVLVALSFVFRFSPRVIAGFAAFIAVVTPVMVISGYIRGAMPLYLVIFDTIVFAWVLWTCVGVFRNQKPEENS